MSESLKGKKIFVFLVTGDQGKSAAKYLIKDGFEVYGLTRDPSSDKAKEVEKLGVHLCKGDMADVTSYEKYLEGMYGVFINADFWGPYYSSGLDAEYAAKTEGSHSKAAVDACVKAGVSHIVYSTLGDIEGNIYPKGAYPHHDSKGEVSKYIIKIGAPCTHLFTSTYISNCVKFNYLKPQSDGSYIMEVGAMDDCPLPAYAVEQLGAWITAAFKDPKKWIGGHMDAISDFSTVAQTAKILSEVTGKKIDTLHLTEEQFEAQELKDKITPELWLQFKQFQMGHMPRDIEQSKSIVPDQWDVRAWAEQSPELEELMHWRK